MLYTFNLYSAKCQLYLNKAKKKKYKKGNKEKADLGWECKCH